MVRAVTTRGAFWCCGTRIDALTMDDAVQALRGFAREPRGRAVHLCNAYSLSLALGNPEVALAINRGDLNLADGAPLAWIGRQVGFSHMRHRVYGPDLMLATVRAGRDQGLRHYLYGSTPEVVGALTRRLEALAPGVEIVGTESPPFRPLTDAEETRLVERIGDAGAQLMWVGLGTPRQDLFVDRFRDRVDCTLVAIGAAFDFLAGAKPQAPTWMRDRGLEWAFRLATEPRRLWRRYLIGNAVFLAGVGRGVRVADRRTTIAVD